MFNCVLFSKQKLIVFYLGPKELIKTKKSSGAKKKNFFVANQISQDISNVALFKGKYSGTPVMRLFGGPWVMLAGWSSTRVPLYNYYIYLYLRFLFTQQV